MVFVCVKDGEKKDKWQIEKGKRQQREEGGKIRVQTGLKHSLEARAHVFLVSLTAFTIITIITSTLASPLISRLLTSASPSAVVAARGRDLLAAAASASAAAAASGIVPIISELTLESRRTA
jgi:hypothetical protein